MITKLVLDTVLHHVSMSWIVETNQQLDYDIDNHNPDWITDGPWYNTYICTKLHGRVFGKLLEVQELTDIIVRVILVHMRNIIHNLLMMVAAMVVMHYHQI